MEQMATFERVFDGCIADDDAVALVQGALHSDDAQRIRAHAEECTICRATVAALAKMPSVRRGASVATSASTLVAGDRGELVSPSVPGELIAGRYVVGEVIGAGGMGIIYLARDATLGRMVALKRVRRVRSAQTSAEHDRLVHEARMMAQLSHPCVVTVFDAGIADGAAYVAMEHVDGVTLRSWLLARRRSWREIAAVFAQAAQGLAAAHAAGMVHGDFKPENVLVDRAGRARVADFGLARAAVAGRNGATREVAGTIAYMAPEQLAGQLGDVASDQYAFCVSLFEALHGARPGERDDETTPARVPAWLRRVYERGLVADRAQRYPSMDAIASALDGGGRRTGRWAGVAAAILVGTIIVVAATARATTEPAPVCRRSPKPSQIWDAPKHQAVRAAFLATGKPYAEHAWITTEHTLDRYAQDWAAASQEACEATHVHRTQSADLLDLRSACLDARLAELTALVGVFAGADATVVENAAKSSGGLTSLAICSDTAGLKEPVPLPPDPAVRVRLAGVRAQLARAKALDEVGKSDEARKLAILAATEAHELGHRPLEAEALLLRGNLETDTDLDAAEKTLKSALLAAEAGRHPRIAANTLLAMSRIFGEPGRFEEANEAVRHALSVIEGLGNHDELLANALHYAGANQMAQGRLDEARDNYLRALPLLEKFYGPDHFRTAATLNNLAHVERVQGRVGEAASLQRRALAALEKSLGSQHPFVASALSVLGDILIDQGDLDAALVARKRAVEIRKAALGPDSVQLAAAFNVLGLAHYERGELEPARSALLDAAATYGKALGPDHYKVGYALTNLGLVYAKMGELAKARSSCRRALALFEPQLDPNAVELAYALACIGDNELAANAAVRALAPLERSVVIFERSGVTREAAESKFRLAQARWRMNKDRKRAMSLAHEAHDALVAIGLQPVRPLIAEIRRWIDKRSTPPAARTKRA